MLGTTGTLGPLQVFRYRDVPYVQAPFETGLNVFATKHTLFHTESIVDEWLIGYFKASIIVYIFVFIHEQIFRCCLPKYKPLIVKVTKESTNVSCGQTFSDVCALKV
jgi:hypothetical protein